MRRRELVLFAAVLLAGCGSDESGSSSVDTVATTTSTAELTTTAEATTTTPTASTVAVGTTVPTPIDAALAARLDRVFADIDPSGPGCSAAVSQDGAVVWTHAAGLADVEAGRPIDATTRFDIASTSKQFTATAILLLEADGEIDGEMALADVLYELPGWAQDVTIDDIVHHTSGIPDYLDLLDVEYEERATQQDAVDALMDVDELDFGPGSDWEYSNSNYLLLAEVVHRLTDVPLPEYLAQHVFAPLGLDMVMDPVGDGDGTAVSYEWTGDEWEPQTSGWEQVGDGAIQTTPSELVRWASQYWEPTLGGTEVLDARTAGAVDVGDGTRYGAGIVVDGDELSHDGSWLGFVTELIVVPDARAASAVSCNVSDADPTAYAESLLDVWGSR